MPTLDQMNKTPIRERKQLAMGVNGTAGEADGIPDGHVPHETPKLSRGPGRAPDAKSSGMPKCDPETPPFWAGGKDSQVGSDQVSVGGHVRSKPIGNRSY